MNTKLTLRIDRQIIEAAKAYAGRIHKPLSRIVADYFSALQRQEIEPQEITPAVASLRGVLKDGTLDKADYKKYLQDKYL